MSRLFCLNYYSFWLLIKNQYWTLLLEFSCRTRPVRRTQKTFFKNIYPRIENKTMPQSSRHVRICGVHCLLFLSLMDRITATVSTDNDL